MSKKIVLCDLDGVIVDLLPEWLARYGYRTGEYLFTDNIKTWHFSEGIKNQEEFRDALSWALSNAPPKEGATALSEMLTNPDLDVYIVTYVPQDCPSGYDRKLTWLRNYFPQLNQDKVIFAKHKEIVFGHFLIEDNGDNLDAWLEQNPAGLGFIVDAPYNQLYSHERCVRVNCVRDVYEYMKEENLT